jgi:nucleotide-binding universal stress UspA family protein
MFKQVLVGVGDDQGGRDAIALGRLLAGSDGDGALTLGHIFHADPSVPWGFQDPTKPTLEEQSHQLLEQIAGQTGVSAHLRWYGAPSVGRGLHELAEAIDADLLVVGSSRHAMLGRVRLADHMRAALNGAPCAVAIAPAGYADEPSVVREIGVAYDGSPESEHALAVARTLAAGLGTKLSAFQAVPLPVFGWSGLPTARTLGVPVDDMIKQARERIEGLGGVEAHVASGAPGEELTVYSASLDLLVVGSRSYGPVGRLIHGGVSEHLARTARCPLLVLPRGVRDAAAAPASEARSDAVATSG